MYKDADKQREAQRDWVRQKRAKEQGSTVGSTKRGKDIKVFEDLPSHVQQTIDMMSTVDGKIDKIVKANRTAIAVNYQHQFPDRFHSTGVAI